MYPVKDRQTPSSTKNYRIDGSRTSCPIAYSSPAYLSASLSFSAGLARRFWKTWLSEMRVGFPCLFDSNAHRAGWLHRGEKPSTQAKPNVHLKKVLLCCLWESKGMLYHDLLPRGIAVTAVVYATQLQELEKVYSKSGRDDLQCTSFMIRPNPM